MQHVCIEWLHQFRDEPVVIFSENDDEGWETRKVEVFANGTSSYASATEQTGDTHLAEVVMPPLEEIAAQPEFQPRLISQREFEAIWAMARQKRNGKTPSNKRRPLAGKKLPQTVSTARRRAKRR